MVVRRRGSRPRGRAGRCRDPPSRTRRSFAARGSGHGAGSRGRAPEHPAGRARHARPRARTGPRGSAHRPRARPRFRRRAHRAPGRDRSTIARSGGRLRRDRRAVRRSAGGCVSPLRGDSSRRRDPGSGPGPGASARVRRSGNGSTRLHGHQRLAGTGAGLAGGARLAHVRGGQNRRPRLVPSRGSRHRRDHRRSASSRTCDRREGAPAPACDAGRRRPSRGRPRRPVQGSRRPTGRSRPVLRPRGAARRRRRDVCRRVAPVGRRKGAGLCAFNGLRLSRRPGVSRFAHRCRDRRPRRKRASGARVDAGRRDGHRRGNLGRSPRALHRRAVHDVCSWARPPRTSRPSPFSQPRSAGWSQSRSRTPRTAERARKSRSRSPRPPSGVHQSYEGGRWSGSRRRGA